MGDQPSSGADRLVTGQHCCRCQPGLVLITNTEGYSSACLSVCSSEQTTWRLESELSKEKLPCIQEPLDLILNTTRESGEEWGVWISNSYLQKRWLSSLEGLFLERTQVLFPAPT